MKLIKKYLNPDGKILYTGFDWHNRLPISYNDIENEPIPDNAPKSKRTSLLDTPIMVQTIPTASTASTFGQHMPKYESTPKRLLITLGATVAAPFLPSIGQYGLQAMNTAFTPSTWLNPVTGAKLLSPTAGTVADAGIQGAFTYEGLNGLKNQSKQGTLLSDPTSTAMHGLEILPMIGMGARGTQYMYNKAKPFMNFLWNDGKVIQRKMPYNSNNFYREISKEAIDDAISSGVVRTGDANKYIGPYFAKGSTPWRREKFIIEGYPDKNDWVYAEPYQNAIWLGEEDASLGRKAMEEALNHLPKPLDASIGVHIFPYTNGSVNSTPTSNFTYWQRHPIIGWRQHTFDNVAKAKRAYSKPTADIMPVEGSISTNDIPNITSENASSITPELWTAAQDAAIARGDMTEAQRLRDLHFRVQAPNSKIVDKNGNPIHSYHGTGKHFNEFNTTGKYSTLDEGYYGVGAYFSPNKELAQIYADTEKTPIVYDTYLNIKNPLKHVVDENTNLYGKTIVDNDGVISTLPDDLVDKTFDMTEYVATKPNQIKLADAVTYGDDGVRIGLGNRDNFNNSDIRYGLLPFILGGYKYINRDSNSTKYVNEGKLKLIQK